MRNINQYLGVSEVEKKQNGEVFTPFELISEMLDTLPKDVWTNPNLKWLDSCTGVGNFIAIVLKRLMEGLKDWEPNEKKRYKHIMENMIYVCELTPKNMLLYLNIFDPNNEYDMKYHRGSFLDEGFNNKMKEWGIEGFDISVGNPPYQDINSDGKVKHGSGKLYPSFIQKSINILNKDGFLLFVNPNTWFSGSGDSMTGKLFSLFKKYNLISLTTEKENISLQKKYFNGVGTGELTHFLLCKNNNYNKTKVNDRFFINIYDYDMLPNILNELTMSIMLKIMNVDKKLNFVKDSNVYHSKKTTRNDNKQISKTRKDNYFPIINTITKKEGIKLLYSPHENYFQKMKKILISQSSSYDTMIIDHGEYGFTQNITALIVDDNDDINNIYKLLNSKLYTFFIKIMKFGPAISPRILKLLPDVKFISDEKLYDYFKLSEKEIDIIIKNC